MEAVFIKKKKKKGKNHKKNNNKQNLIALFINLKTHQ